VTPTIGSQGEKAPQWEGGLCIGEFGNGRRKKSRVEVNRLEGLLWGRLSKGLRPRGGEGRKKADQERGVSVGEGRWLDGKKAGLQGGGN